MGGRMVWLAAGAALVAWSCKGGEGAAERAPAPSVSDAGVVRTAADECKAVNDIAAEMCDALLKGHGAGLACSVGLTLSGRLTPPCTGAAAVLERERSATASRYASWTYGERCTKMVELLREDDCSVPIAAAEAERCYDWYASLERAVIRYHEQRETNPESAATTLDRTCSYKIGDGVGPPE